MVECVCVLPAHEYGSNEACDDNGPATRTRWGNGQARLLTVENFTVQLRRRTEGRA